MDEKAKAFENSKKTDNKVHEDAARKLTDPQTDIAGLQLERLRMIIERAEHRDLRHILALQKLAYRSEAEIYNDYTIPPLTQSFKEIESDFENQTFLKVVFDGRIIGSVRAYMISETCFIGRLIVHPDFQNRGIGTRLMNEIEKCFRKARRFELFTGHRSERNIHLYQKLGYQVFKRVIANKHLELVYMEKINKPT